MIALSSCSEDNTFTTTPGDSQGDNVTLSLNVTNDNFNARSRYGEGTDANWLRYAVYEQTTTEGKVSYKHIDALDYSDESYTGSAQLDIQLAKDKTYTIVFFACSSRTTPYFFYANENSASLYQHALSCVYKTGDDGHIIDGGDAFYATKTVTVTGNQQLGVSLTRPLAQINIGASDYDAATKIGINPSISSLSAKAYQHFNLFTGQPEGELTDVELPYTYIDRNQKYPVTKSGQKIEYLAVGYFFVDKTTTDVTVKYMNEGEDEINVGLNDDVKGNKASEKVRTITNVPVQPNYQTNIYGQILTSTIGLDIDTKPGFDGGNNEEIIEPVADLEELNEVLNNIEDGAVIGLPEIDLDAKNINFPEGKEFTLVGQGADKTTLSNIGYIPVAGSTINFKNLTLSVESNGTATSIGFQNLIEANYTDVTFKGEFHTFQGVQTFKNCRFIYGNAIGNTSARYGLWVDAYGKTVVEDCVFDIASDNPSIKPKAVLVYSDNNTEMADVDFINCEFIIKDTPSEKAAIEIHSDKFTSAGTININGAKWNTGDFIKLWQEVDGKNGDAPTTYYTVYVDGQLVQQGN